MSIRWIRNVLIDNEKSTVEIQLGERSFGDKCYTRIGKELEQWFDCGSTSRAEIIAHGIQILQRRLSGKSITYPDGQEYDWK